MVLIKSLLVGLVTLFVSALLTPPLTQLAAAHRCQGNDRVLSAHSSGSRLLIRSSPSSSNASLVE